MVLVFGAENPRQFLVCVSLALVTLTYGDSKHVIEASGSINFGFVCDLFFWIRMDLSGNIEDCKFFYMLHAVFDVQLTVSK